MVQDSDSASLGAHSKPMQASAKECIIFDSSNCKCGTISGPSMTVRGIKHLNNNATMSPLFAVWSVNTWDNHGQ